jgi:NAD(P)-dependent dehydrogenase (short-subunit alcohol dehydrogenase family)
MSDTEALFQAARPRYAELAGQVAIVTGASKGIGRGIAIRLAREGMKVVLTARSGAELETTTRELRDLGCPVLSVPGDIANRDDVERLFAETLANFGTLDLLVNNAANLHRVGFFDVTEDMMLDELNTNVMGPFLSSYRAAKIMKDKNRGRGNDCRGSIVHISSVGGLRAHFPGLPYDATKGALDSLTRVMGIELAGAGVRVNGIAPGAIYTQNRRPLDDPGMIEYARRIPANRLGMPLEIGAVVAFLASDDASYINGQTIYVDGGITAQLSPQEVQI